LVLGASLFVHWAPTRRPGEAMGNIMCQTCDAPGTGEFQTGSASQQDSDAVANLTNQVVTSEYAPNEVQTDKVVNMRIPGDGQTLTNLDQLEGKWSRQVDGMPMGEIAAGKVLWHTSYQHPPSALTWLTSGDVEMDLAGVAHWGRYEGGPPPSLRWSDGEVWVLTGKS